MGVRLKILSRESEELLRFAYVKDIAGISLFTPVHRRTEHLKSVAKRAFDLVGSVVLILLLSPVFIAVAFAILLEDGGPILFTQERALSHGGRSFRFLKFRSMVKNAEEQQGELYEKNQATGGLFMVDQDPRITRVGRIIRRHSIDELPQLFNVLRGDMSLVGPRPLTVSDLSNISPENKLGGYYRLREKGKPGMTGLWQISGRREVAFKEMALLDLYYIENQSLLFDIEILAKTIPVVLFGKGGY
jgi:lipopolysaccharide/colanic/teichoic acid biosynthesis glycosyltransferase